MSKIPFLFILAIPLSSVFGQTSFSDVLKLENKSYSEIQAHFFARLSFIEEERKWHYQGFVECDPPTFLQNGCDWACSKSVYSSEYYDSEHEEHFEDENYKCRETRFFTSHFAENYDYSSETATTFVTLKERKSRSNTNCKSALIERPGRVCIELQVNSTRDWQLLKSQVSEFSVFKEAWRWDAESAPDMRYQIRRTQLDDGTWTGVAITLQEQYSGRNFAKFCFDSIVD